jgi:predicted outer membrane repeat protein
VSALALTLCLAHPVYAADQLLPRAEVNVRAGTERSILMTEFWAPLAQQSDRVLYGDLRLMGDDDSNKEGNLGFGYRQINPKFNSVLGANVWIDRRRTERGNNFHQLTLGVESLGETIDLRANGYIQLNSAKTTVTPNIGSATPYLAGSNIFFDTNGFIIEEPQDGFDAEVGLRLPIFQKYIDTTRIYAGGYHFFGDTTDNVTGFRLRTEAQVNSIFSVGARFQHDGPRGSQGFLEATLRFPFKSKKLFQQEGLRSRLDESPERDIDIVTGSKVDTGLAKPVLNTSGTEQRILYVDNTAQANGTGTKENPFNTLATAQAALHANDILYVNRGDGTTTGMDQGIVIDKANVQLIGSGSALTYGGYTLINAGQSPAITNIQTSTDDYTGNAVYAYGGNITIAGLTLNGAQGNGVFVLANAGKNFSNVTVTNITSSNNLKQGIVIGSDNAAIDIMSVTYSTVSNNIQAGINLYTVNAGRAGTMLVENNTANTNGGGIVAQGYTNSIIGSIIVQNNIANNNTTHAIASYIRSGTKTDYLLYENNTALNNIGHEINLSPSNTDSLIKEAVIRGNLTSNNQDGLLTSVGVGSQISKLTIENNNSFNNSVHGFDVTVSGNLISGEIKNNTSNRNGQNGILVFGANSGNLTVSISGNTATENAPVNYYGIRIDNDTSGTFNVDLGGGGLSTGNNRIYGNYYRDILIDSRPGTVATTPGVTISAQNNWWGINTGLNQGTRATFDNGSATPGSSIDASNFLTVDPGI